MSRPVSRTLTDLAWRVEVLENILFDLSIGDYRRLSTVAEDYQQQVDAIVIKIREGEAR